MNFISKSKISGICIFIWVGCILSITFIETPFVFHQSGLPLSIGLKLSSLIFRTLNTLEWLFAILILLPFLFTPVKRISAHQFVFLAVLLILMIQTIWLFTTHRIPFSMQYQNGTVAGIRLYFLNVVADILKTSCLIFVGTNQLIA